MEDSYLWEISRSQHEKRDFIAYADNEGPDQRSGPSVSAYTVIWYCRIY